MRLPTRIPHSEGSDTMINNTGGNSGSGGGGYLDRKTTM